MYKIFDQETTTGVVAKRKASPFGGINRKVALGWKNQGKGIHGQYFESREAVKELYIEPEITILVGHNIKFDLLWEWGNDSMRAFIRRGGKVWCTQLAEYLLEGQTQASQMNAMSDIAEAYGGNTKVDAVKEMWNAGIDTPDIPKDLLMRYLLGGPDPETGQEEHGDIGNTELIFLGQIKRAKSMGMLRMIQQRMESLLATTEMEYNGLRVDEAGAENDRMELAELQVKLAAELDAYIPDDVPFEFSWGSWRHKSALIFGGRIKYEQWVHYDDPTSVDGFAYVKRTEKWPLFRKRPVSPCDPRLSNRGTPEEPHFFYGEHSQDVTAGGKNAGMPKFKNVKVDDLDKPKGAKQSFYYEFPGHTTPDAKWASSTEGYWSTAADVVEELGARDIPFLQALIGRVRADKILGTYYWVENKDGVRTGMMTLVEDGWIHHSLNHTSTVTTRLSSSNPNGQNMPRGSNKPGGKVKRMFTSRFVGGKVGEVDYSQLEVVGQGVLSGDLQLREDLRARIDFHCKRLAYRLNEPYADVLRKAKDELDEAYGEYNPMRTGAKEFSFQRAYGAGAPAIASSTGMSIEIVEALIEAEEKLYPGIVAFNEMVADTVRKSRKPLRIFKDNPVTGGVVQCGVGEYFGPTGTRFVFQEEPAPAWLQRRGTLTSFSPTEMKNYPVQGFSGEIVQVMIGKLFREYVRRGWWSGEELPAAVLTNTVHDCVWNDMRDDSVVSTVLGVTVEVLESVPDTMNALYPDLAIDVPFPVEAEYGDNMFDLHHWEVKDEA